MMPGVNHQKAQEVHEPQAAKNGMVEMCPPLIRGGCEIRFEIFEHLPKKDPAREQLHDPGLNWPGEGTEKHPSTLLVGERHVFRHLPRRPLARRTRQGPLLGRNPACRCDEGADCLAVAGDRILKISHVFYSSLGSDVGTAVRSATSS